MTRLRVLVAVGVFAMALCPSLALAATPEEAAAADALFEQARALVSQGNHAEACPKFEESQRLDPASGTLINLADCYERTGRTASAFKAYQEAAVSAARSGNLDREKVARERAEALKPSLPRIALSVAAADTTGLEVRRDGIVIGQPEWGSELPVDPGQHTIEARAPGRVPFQTTIDAVPAGPVVNVSIPELVLVPSMVATPTPEPTRVSSRLGTQRTLAIVTAGVGLVGVGLGTYFGLHSKFKHDESYELCPSDPCSDPGGREAMRAALKSGTISTVSFIAGGVAVAAGGILWFTAKKPSEAATALGIGPDRIELRGRF